MNPQNPTVQSIVVSLETLRRAMHEEADTALRLKTGLSMTQMLMIYTMTQDNCVSQIEIAGMLGISQPAVSKQLHQLIDAGLATEVKLNKRAWTVSLTPQGKQKFEQAFLLYDKLCINRFSGLTDKEQSTLLKLLQKSLKLH